MKISCTTYKTVCVIIRHLFSVYQGFLYINDPRQAIYYKYCTVEIKGLGTRLLSCLKRSSAELPLRAGLIHAVWTWSVFFPATYEPRPSSAVERCNIGKQCSISTRMFLHVTNCEVSSSRVGNIVSMTKAIGCGMERVWLARLRSTVVTVRIANGRCPFGRCCYRCLPLTWDRS